MRVNYFPKYIFNIHQYGPDHHITSSGKSNIFLTKARTKDTAQNTPKDAISSKKIHFFLGRGLGLSQTPPVVARVSSPTTYPFYLPSLWNLPLHPPIIPSGLTPDSKPNVHKILLLPHIPTKLCQPPISSFSLTVQTDRHTQTHMDGTRNNTLLPHFAMADMV